MSTPGARPTPGASNLDGIDSGALQWARKSAFAYEAAERTNALLDAGLHRLAPLATPASSATGIAVINPSSWPRTDLVRVFIPESRLLGGESFAIIEELSGARVPYVREGQLNPSNRPRGCWVTFLARDVPAMGYARYVVESGATAASSSRRNRSSRDDGRQRSRSDAFRLSANLSEAHIAELIDRSTGRDLIDQEAPFGFNEYIYDVYATAPGFNHLSSRVAASDLCIPGVALDRPRWRGDRPRIERRLGSANGPGNRRERELAGDDGYPASRRTACRHQQQNAQDRDDGEGERLLRLPVCRG